MRTWLGRGNNPIRDRLCEGANARGPPVAERVLRAVRAAAVLATPWNSNDVMQLHMMNLQYMMCVCARICVEYVPVHIRACLDACMIM